MGVVIRKDSPYYWLTLPRHGLKPLRRATRILVQAASAAQQRENRRLAELEYHAAMTALAKGRLEPSTVQTVTLGKFLTRYLKSIPDQPETQRRLKQLFLPVFGHLPLSQIRPTEIAKWRATRTGVTDQTIVRDITALRGVLAKAREWDVIDHNPLAELRLKARPGRTITRYLLPEEETLLYASMARRDEAARDARDRYNKHRIERNKAPLPRLRYFADWLTPMVILSLNTGIRKGELFHLTWASIDTHTGTLTVTAETAKSRKTRHVPLNTTAILTLTRWQEQTNRKKGLIFPNPRSGQRMTNVQSSWEELLIDAGIHNFRWHDLRHSFASKLVQKGVNLRVVQELLGHASIKQTERYAHLAPNQSREAVNLITPHAR